MAVCSMQRKSRVETDNQLFTCMFAVSKAEKMYESKDMISVLADEAGNN